MEAKPYAFTAGTRAVNEHLGRTGWNAEMVLTETGSIRQLRFAMPPDQQALVSIIIPTRNGRELVQRCIESILSKSSYARYEIILIDNASDDAVAVDYFKQLSGHPCIRVLRDDRRFNYSALNNAAVQHARGELICLLNNDTEVISPDWLQQLAVYATRPEIGAVGARLWYPDDTLQHGGVILGIGGVAGHSHKGLPMGAAGYFGRATTAQTLSAVTAACLMVRRSVYQEVGGLDEALAIAFNDTDFCLRVRAAGYRNVWTPSAELYHHESASRGYEDSPEKRQRFGEEVRFMQRRWGSDLLTDPAYSPNLTLSGSDFSLAWPSRVPQL